MEINIKGTLSKEEFLKTAVLANHPILKKNRYRLDLWVILLFSGLLLICLSVLGVIADPDYYPLVLVGTIAGLILITIAVKLRNAVSQLWKTRYASDPPQFEGRITEEFIDLHDPTSQARYLWSNFTGYGEYREIVVLVRDSLAFPFPRHFFQSESDWQQFKALVQEKLPLTHQVKPIRPGNILIWLLLLFSISVLLFELYRNR